MTLSVPDPPLSDGVVTLRPPEERDLPSIDLGIHDADVIRWFGLPGASAAEVLALNRIRWAAGSPTFSICESDDACVGHVWLNLSPSDATVGAVGYWLLPGARGRGHATRAVRLLAAWAVHDVGITRLRLFTEPANERSQRVAERSGFQRIVVLPHHDEVDGREIDHVLFEMPGKSD